MRVVPLVVLAALFSSTAYAADFSVTASSGYLFEKQAYSASSAPVLNVSADFALSESLSTNVWAQAGDEHSQELDLTATYTKQYGPVTTHVMGGGYFYPTTGFKPIYTVEAGASVPVGPVMLDASVERYEGDLKSTVYTVTATHEFKISERLHPSVTFGKSYNDPEDLAPWFVRVSHPLGPVTVGFRAFWGAGHDVTDAAVVEITKNF